MKNIVSIMFVFILFCTNVLISSELKFNPADPKAGDTISVVFSGNSRYNNLNEIDLLYYSFNSNDIYPTGYEIKLTKNGANWNGKFVIPNDAVYIMFKVFATGDYIDIIDNNNGLYWELLVKADGTYVKGANLRAALARLGSITANIDRLPEYHLAIKFLEEELKLYPDNLAAELGLVTTLFDTKKISNQEFQKRLNEIAFKQINESDEAAVRTKVRALYAVNEQDQANKLEAKFGQLHPNSGMAEDLLISEISNAGSLLAFVNSSKLFFSRFPNSINRERVFIAYISGYMQGNKIQELIKSLDSIDNVHGYVYARIARNMFEYFKEKKVLNEIANRELIISLLEKAEKSTEEQAKSELSDKPKIYTKGEWLDILDIQLGTIKEIKAEIYKEFEPVNSVPLYENAIILLRNNASEALYENLIELLVTLGDSAKALQVSENAIIHGKISDKITDFHRESSRNLLYMNDSLYNLRADSIYQKAKVIKKEIYLNEILDQDEFQYTLETLEGTFVDFRDLKEKVTIFNFFASWCDPCVTMFPAFQELYNLYLNNDEVEIVSVNTLENQNFSLESLKRFVTQNDISFPVVRDVMDIIPRQMGVNGLPTIAIFDKNSHVRFLVKGFSNNEKLLDEVAGRIEFLLTNGE